MKKLNYIFIVSFLLIQACVDPAVDEKIFFINNSDSILHFVLIHNNCDEDFLYEPYVRNNTYKIDDGRLIVDCYLKPDSTLIFYKNFMGKVFITNKDIGLEFFWDSVDSVVLKNYELLKNINDINSWNLENGNNFSKFYFEIENNDISL